jgi:protein-disulfide isomerase
VPGLSLSQWTSDRNNPQLAESVSTDAQTANNSGFTGTPSFLLGKTGGSMSKYEYQSLTDPTGWNEAFEKLIKS